jgi:hypothetical protein
MPNNRIALKFASGKKHAVAGTGEKREYSLPRRKFHMGDAGNDFLATP